METCKSRNVKKIAIAGGVASNSALRETIMNAASKKGIEVLFPAPVLCTDNAAMIGSAAYFNLVNGKISDLNLNVEEGCVLGILGPNGHGKTTLLNVIAGLLKPESGSVKIDGKEVGEKTKEIVS